MIPVDEKYTRAFHKPFLATIFMSVLKYIFL
jgi:hypothetical protein